MADLAPAAPIVVSVDPRDDFDGLQMSYALQFAFPAFIAALREQSSIWGSHRGPNQMRSPPTISSWCARHRVWTIRV